MHHTQLRAEPIGDAADAFDEQHVALARGHAEHDPVERPQAAPFRTGVHEFAHREFA